MRTFLPRCRLVLLLGMIALLGACASKPRVEFVPDADYAKYRTFTWAPEDVHEVDDPILDSPILQQRVMRAATAAMRYQGFEQDNENPDLLVTYHTASKERLRAVGYNIGLGYPSYYHYWRHSIHFARPDIESYEQGVLIIDIVDKADDRLIWRGWETAVLNQRNFSAEQIRQMIDRIIARFPPL